MTDQNQPDRPETGSSGHSDQWGRPLEDVDGQPRYGIRLTPEQLAHQSEQHSGQSGQQASGGQQGYPAPNYGQAGQSPYGEPSQGQSPYGQSPYGQSLQGQQPGRQPYPQQAYGYPNQSQPQMGPVERPKQIDRSYWLILTAGLAFLIVELMNLFQPNLGLTPEMTQDLESQLDAAGVAVTLESVMDSMRIFMIVVIVILVGLYVLIASGIRRGSNVARIFGTIFAVMSLVALFGPGFVYAALGIAGIAFAYLRPSNEYFRGKAWERAMRR